MHLIAFPESIEQIAQPEFKDCLALMAKSLAISVNRLIFNLDLYLLISENEAKIASEK